MAEKDCGQIGKARPKDERRDGDKENCDFAGELVGSRTGSRDLLKAYWQ
jgi:hypothetical protein